MDMLLTFREGQAALEALTFDLKEVGGQQVRLRLLSPDWRDQIEQELSLVRCNTAALFNTTTNSLLGEDFTIPTMSFDIDDEDDEVAGLTVQDAFGGGHGSRGSSPVRARNTPDLTALNPQQEGRSGSPGCPLSPSRPGRLPIRPPGAPGRGPSPSRPPGAPPRLSPVPPQESEYPVPDMVVPQAEESLGGAPPALNVKPEKSKPPRPGAPPNRPPPPSRPQAPGGPPRNSPVTAQEPKEGAVPGGPARGSRLGQARQPMRPHMMPKSTRKPQRVSMIGLPTNVSHTGHATSVEEAEKLIEKLMSTGSLEGPDLPPPIQPSPASTPSSASTPGSEPPQPAPRRISPTKELTSPGSQPVPRARSSYEVTGNSPGGSVPRNKSEDNIVGLTKIEEGPPAPKPRPRNVSSPTEEEKRRSPRSSPTEPRGPPPPVPPNRPNAAEGEGRGPPPIPTRPTVDTPPVPAPRRDIKTGDDDGDREAPPPPARPPKGSDRPMSMPPGAMPNPFLASMHKGSQEEDDEPSSPPPPSQAPPPPPSSQAVNGPAVPPRPGVDPAPPPAPARAAPPPPVPPRRD